MARAVVLLCAVLGLGAALVPCAPAPRRLAAVRAEEPSAEKEAASAPPKPLPGRYDVSKLVSRPGDGPGFNQFDPVLSTTGFLSRRLGIAGGLTVFGALALVEGDEIVKALTESKPVEASGDLIRLPSGLSYRDVLIGKGGNLPLPGSIVGLKAVVTVGDMVLYDTKDEKPIAFKLGQRPFQNVICEGVEAGIAGMRVGGKRTLYVPPSLAPPGAQLPPGTNIVYDIEVTEVLQGYF